MRNYLNWSFCFLLGNTLLAQEKTAFTLAEAKQYALSNHLSVLNARLDSEAAVYKKNETRGIGLPQANLNGTFTHFINLPVQVVSASFINPNAGPDETISFRAGTDYSSAGNFQVNQILFNGSYLVGLQVSKQYVEFSKSLEGQTMEEVAFAVIQAYNMAAIAKDNLHFVDSLVGVTQNMVEKQKNFLELGLMKQEEFDQLLYSLQLAQSSRSSARIQYENALTMLKLTMNYPIEKEIVIEESSNQLMVSQQIAQGSLANNRSLLLMNKRLELKSYALKNERFAGLPSLNTFFQQSYNAFRNEFDLFSNKPWFSQTFWGLQLSIPVLSGGQRHYRIQQAKVEVMKSQNSIKLLEQSLQMQEAQAKNNWIASMEQYELQKANVQLAERIYGNSLIKEQIGSESSILVTQKYNQLLMAQTQLTASKIQVFSAKLNLEKLYNQILQTNP